jgi:hypothetical protein
VNSAILTFPTFPRVFAEGPGSVSLAVAVICQIRGTAELRAALYVNGFATLNVLNWSKPVFRFIRRGFRVEGTRAVHGGGPHTAAPTLCDVSHEHR